MKKEKKKEVITLEPVLATIEEYFEDYIREKLKETEQEIERLKNEIETIRAVKKQTDEQTENNINMIYTQIRDDGRFNQIHRDTEDLERRIRWLESEK